MSKSPSLRRIQADIRELALDPSDQYHASPLENDMFEWHFTIRGAKGTDFEGGVYHGRILLPPDYPFKPPHIMFLTPSGRFETNTKVCLSFSAYHPELWQPAWGIRLILEALISFLPTPADGAIGALDWSTKERQRLAKKSVEWSCPSCGKITELIPKKEKSGGESPSPSRPSRFAKEIEELRRLQMVEHRKAEDDSKEGTDPKPDDTSESADGQQEAPLEETPALSSEKAQEATNTGDLGTSSSEAVAMERAIVESPTALTANSDSTSEVDANRSLVAENTTSTEATVVRPASSGVWWFVDPLLQLIIIVLSGICYLLLQKVRALCADLRELD
ncbi:hypothetical protein ACA910_011244 [Epithemia clementina (nom. ined.)]